jgi:hypothetical protein
MPRRILRDIRSDEAIQAGRPPNPRQTPQNGRCMVPGTSICFALRPWVDPMVGSTSAVGSTPAGDYARFTRSARRLPILLPPLRGLPSVGLARLQAICRARLIAHTIENATISRIVDDVRHASLEGTERRHRIGSRGRSVVCVGYGAGRSKNRLATARSRCQAPR